MPLCVYCGQLADTIDHVFPRAYLAMIEDAVPVLERPRQQLVDCCRRCNSILGSKVFPSFEARRDWIRAELLRRGETIDDVPTPAAKPARLPIRERPSPKRMPAAKPNPIPLGHYTLTLAQMAEVFGHDVFKEYDLRKVCDISTGNAVRSLLFRWAIEETEGGYRISDYGWTLVPAAAEIWARVKPKKESNPAAALSPLQTDAGGLT